MAPALSLPARADVAIVGAGFAGCATAWALAARGATAIVLEREPELGRYASGRGAGLGRQLAEDDATSALTVRGAALLRERFPGAWQACGGVLTFAEADVAADYAARAIRLGVPCAEIAPAVALARWPALGGLPVAAALHVPSDGVIAARALLDALAAGCQIALGAGAIRIEPGPSGAVRVHTARGTVEARAVVDASGAWAGQLTGEPPLAVFRRHLFVLAASAAPDAPYLWHHGPEELYVRADADGVLVSPCDLVATEPGDEQATAAGDAALAARLEAAASALRGAPIARRWACQRAFAPDRRMRIGRDPVRPWLVWAAALGGHGATAACAVGERAAAAALEALARPGSP
jgi:glycine/D-amino acid oxidase-like deaminating enzyme